MRSLREKTRFRTCDEEHHEILPRALRGQTETAAPKTPLLMENRSALDQSLRIEEPPGNETQANGNVEDDAFGERLLECPRLFARGLRKGGTAPDQREN